MLKNILILLTGVFALSCSNPYKNVQNTTEDYLIIPKPNSVEITEGRFLIDDETSITALENLTSEGEFLAEYLSKASNKAVQFNTNGDGKIKLELDATLSSDDAYKLVVTYDEVVITGKTNRAVFYGIQTLRQLVSTNFNEVHTLPATVIMDAPRFGYRGMHLDVCRHYFSTDFIKRYIDLLAMHKMNTFHWHLTEDQGWRIEIKKYPKLTEIGAWRNGTIIGHNPGIENDQKVHGGFYTQEEVKEIVAYAAERHITVIPEIELPGHSSAAIAAYPSLSCFPEEPTIIKNNMISEASKEAQANGQIKLVQESWGIYDDVYCAGKEETFTFVENVLEEVIALFPSEYIHIGGDECPKGNWERCPNCQKRMKENGLADEHELQSYFITRVEKFVNSKGKNIIGWDEILEGGLAPNATVMSWRGNEGGIAAAKDSHTVIMSPNTHCYFDHYQTESRETEPIAIGGFLPVEKVYAFDPIPEELEVEKHQFILGGQANLWTEYIETESHAEYMLLPRMTALSEALWTAKEDKNWDDFKIRLTDFRNTYDALGVNYGKHVFTETVEE